MRATAFLLVVAAMTPARAQYCPPGSPQVGGMSDIVLIYLSSRTWMPDDFLPYVAHVQQPDYTPDDWFFDGFLFLTQMRAPSGGDYLLGSANQTDWEAYLDLLFGSPGYLASLDACIAQVAQRLGTPGRPWPVILMIPYLDRRPAPWGDADGDGQEESPADEAARLRALEWFIEATMRRWKASNFSHLRLWGLYWMNEEISPGDRDVVRAVADRVHDRGLGFHWIPWFRAPGFDRWRELGFDFVIMQPNYAFIDIPAGAAVPDEDRLTHNANLAWEHGLGVEMEMHYSVATSAADQLNLQLYLNHGVDELDGTMRGAVRAWFQSLDLIAQLCRSQSAAARRLYDDCYRFHKGTYQRRPVSLCEGASCSLAGQAAPALTDGLWVTRPDQADRILRAPNPAVMELDLGAVQVVGDVRVQLVAGETEGLVSPTRVAVQTSRDGHDFTPPVQAAVPVLRPLGPRRVGFALGVMEPRLARFVRLEVSAPVTGALGVSEVVVFPSPHALWGRPYRLEGEPADSGPVASGWELTDGRVAMGPDPAAGLQLAAGTGRVIFSLPEPLVPQLAYAHASGTAGGAPARFRVVTGGVPGPWSSELADGGGWLQVPLPRVPTTEFTFELAGDGNTVWDEAMVVPAPNLARGAPYRVSPEFPARYPDTGGRELTDGRVSARGFGDGDTVGWTSRQVTVLLDLAQPRRVRAVRAHSQGGGYAAVHHPWELEVLASDDGAHWGVLAHGAPAREIVFAEPVGNESNELAWLHLDFPPTWARFLKLRFSAPPDVWCWTMLSEVEALDDAVNVAAGCAYHVMPAPYSERRYADNAQRLTDGELGRAGDGWSRAAGWNEGNPEVVVDLLAEHQVSAVRVHCAGGGCGAVFFPRALTIATSLDGAHWTEEAPITQIPPENGDQALVAFLGAELTPRRARYVRIGCERKGWIMLDEVEVYGP